MNSPFQPTGMDRVDSLKGLQLVADTYDNPEEKLTHIRNALGSMGAHDLLEHQFMVAAAEVWARPRFDSRRLIHFGEGFLFIAKLEAVGYLLDPHVPLDTLSLNFTDPEVWGIDEVDAPDFKVLKFQVPVLAIDSCMSAEAA